MNKRDNCSSVRNKGVGADHFRGRFTLVELLVVITVISILASMLLPVLKNAMMNARGILCSNKLKQLGLATGMYVNDFADYVPYGKWAPASLYPYLSEKEQNKKGAFVCPEDPEPWLQFVGNCYGANRGFYFTYRMNGQIARPITLYYADVIWKMSGFRHPSYCFNLLPSNFSSVIYAYKGSATKPNLPEEVYWHNNASLNGLHMDTHVKRYRFRIPQCDQMRYWTPDAQ